MCHFALYILADSEMGLKVYGVGVPRLLQCQAYSQALLPDLEA